MLCTKWMRTVQVSCCYPGNNDVITYFPIHILVFDITALHNNGVIGPTWNIIRKLNQGLKAKIKTKDGITREINIKDSIRQGGVLSVLQYATVMDEIAKEIQKTNIGIEIPGSNTKIGCLLWMDDVLLMADNEKDLQTLLNITVNTANKYHIVFGEEKSKIMIMNSKKELKNTMKLGNMTLKTTENYKYLGEIINHKKSMKNPNIRIKKKGRGGTPNHPHYSWGPHSKRHTNGNYMETNRNMHNPHNCICM